MQPLTDHFLEQCPVENGFRMRGEAMTRIEVFVDAAFAFAVTMLVISIDEIPSSVTELLEISKSIPGFVLSVAHLTLIWHFHSVWSKKFGLEDGKTVILSISLVVVMLVFIYPLKIMYLGMFSWLTNQYLPSQFNFDSYDGLRILFYYFAAGFLLVSMVFLALYAHASSRRDVLSLSATELFKTQTNILICINMVLVSLLALVTPALVKDQWVPWTGFTLTLLIPSSMMIRRWRKKKSLQLSLN